MTPREDIKALIVTKAEFNIVIDMAAAVAADCPRIMITPGAKSLLAVPLHYHQRTYGMWCGPRPEPPAFGTCQRLWVPPGPLKDPRLIISQ